MTRQAEAEDVVGGALQAPPDERAYFIRQAVRVLDEDHPARASLEAALEADHEDDVYGLLRAAYGALPPGRDRDDEPCADGGQSVTRRDVLATAAGVGVVGIAGVGTSRSLETDGAIPAPFDAAPTLDDPTERERRIARNTFPPQAVPDAGPIPDPRQQVVERPLTVPAWGMAAARWRLSHADPDDVDRVKVEGILMEYAAIREQFRTPDGREAAGVLLDGVHGGDR